MKNIILLLTLSILLSDCSDDSTGPSPNEKGHLSAKFNGEYWTPSIEFIPIGGPPAYYAGVAFNILNSNNREYKATIPINQYDEEYAIYISGYEKPSNLKLLFIVSDVVGTGEYDITELRTAYQNGITYSNEDMRFGRVNITEIRIGTIQNRTSISNEISTISIKRSSYIKGTFEIECENETSTLNITEGKFFLENHDY